MYMDDRTWCIKFDIQIISEKQNQRTRHKNSKHCGMEYDKDSVLIKFFKSNLNSLLSEHNDIMENNGNLNVWLNNFHLQF